MISKKERTELLFSIKEKRKKRYSEKKVKKKLDKAFRKLNRSTVYKFFEDEDNNTYYNLLKWLVFLEHLCKIQIGKKYKPKDVEDTLVVFFEGNMTYRAAKTLDAINKRLKKTKDKRIQSFGFSSGILASDSFTEYIKSSEQNQLLDDWEVPYGNF